jgi:hypothetical protein
MTTIAALIRILKVIGSMVVIPHEPALAGVSIKPGA